MNYKFLLPVLATALMLTSCSKDSSQDTLPRIEVTRSFQTSGELVIEKTALYTAHGIETNPTVIDSWLKRNFSDPVIQKRFNVNTKTPTLSGPGLYLEFLANNTVWLNHKLVEHTSTTDDMMWFSETEFAEVPALNISHCGSLLNDVPLVTPRTANPEATRYRKSYPIHMSDDDAYVPVIYYASNGHYEEWVNGTVVKTNCATASPEYPQFNLPAHSIGANLAERDTVLIQVARLPLIKKS